MGNWWSRNPGGNSLSRHSPTLHRESNLESNTRNASRNAISDGLHLFKQPHKGDISGYDYCIQGVVALPDLTARSKKKWSGNARSRQGRGVRNQEKSPTTEIYKSQDLKDLWRFTELCILVKTFTDLQKFFKDSVVFFGDIRLAIQLAAYTRIYFTRDVKGSHALWRYKLIGSS